MNIQKNTVFTTALLLSSVLLFTLVFLTDSLSAQTEAELAAASQKLPDLQKKAEEGDSESQFYLGVRYSMGDGVEQNDKEALKWLQKAAKQKNYKAQYVLSLYCMQGRAVPKNEELGMKLLQSAAKGGFAEAQYEYASTLAGQEKMEEALPWMKKAVEQGYVPAQTALGAYYISISKPDSKEAQEGLNLLNLAASQGYVDAQTALGSALVERKEISTGVVWLEVAGLNGEKAVQDLLKGVEVKPEDCYEIATVFFMGDGVIPKNYEKFKYWAEKAATGGSANGQFILGTYYMQGINHEMDAAKGTEYLEKASEQGHAEAQALLAVCYRNGLGVKADPKKAIEVLQKAAKQKNGDAYTQLAFSSLFGLGVTSNPETTQKLFEKAMELNQQNAAIFLDYCKKNSVELENGAAILKQLASAAKEGDAAAQFLMGELYSDGLGVKFDEKNMIAYYTMAVKQNYIPALTALSWVYEMGIQVKENRETAIQLALKAAQQNDPEAISYLSTVGQVEVTPTQEAETTAKKSDEK